MSVNSLQRCVNYRVVLFLALTQFVFPIWAETPQFQEAKQNVDRFAKTVVNLVVKIRNLKPADKSGKVQLLRELKGAVDQTTTTRLRLRPTLTKEELDQLANFERERLVFYSKSSQSLALSPGTQRKATTDEGSVRSDTEAERNAIISGIVQTLGTFASASQPPSGVRQLSRALPPPPPPPPTSPTPSDFGSKVEDAVNRLPYGDSVLYTGGNAVSHCEVQCGLFGPAHAQATCDARTQHATCWCHPNAAVWGEADCGCQPGRPTPQDSCETNLAPPNKQCSIEATDIWCIQAGVVGRDPGQSTACANGFHGQCRPATCSDDTFTYSRSWCEPD